MHEFTMLTKIERFEEEEKTCDTEVIQWYIWYPWRIMGYLVKESKSMASSVISQQCNIRCPELSLIHLDISVVIMKVSDQSGVLAPNIW